MTTHAVGVDRLPRTCRGLVVACLVLASGCSGSSDDQPPGSAGAAGASGGESGNAGSGGVSGSAGANGGIGNNGGSGASGGQLGGNGNSSGTAGSAGSNGGESGNAGSGGAAGGQAGSAGSNGGESGNAGSGGAAGGVAGSAGASGSGGAPASATAVPLSLTFEGQCDIPAQNFTISNTGGSALTWVANVLGVPVRVFPPTSTLLPGTSVTVTVSPFSPPVRFSTGGTITIDTDVAGPVGPIQVIYSVTGYRVTPPSDIDFGPVPLGSHKRISFHAPADSPPGVLLGSSNFNFMLTGNAPADPSPGFWTLIFTPIVVGSQSTTLTLGSFSGPVCPPNTFTATGVGVAP